VALAAAKKRIVFDELFNFALGISLVSALGARSEAYPCGSTDLRALLNLLPYSLTSAQERVIEEIRADMQKNTAMSRIVIGDVGCGKTVCAAAAMLFAVQSGRQAALMAPTEILAKQHYASLLEIFERLGIRSALLVGATPATEKRRIYAALASSGEDRIDVVIGNNDGMAMGALTAIQTAGRVIGEDIYLVGVDALPEAVELIKEGEMTGTVLNDHIGQSHAAVDVAVKLLNGEDIENYYWVDYVKVDKAYVDAQ
jgi:hypothetical protein